MDRHPDPIADRLVRCGRRNYEAESSTCGVRLENEQPAKTHKSGCTDSSAAQFGEIAAYTLGYHPVCFVSE
jgi:hypothetical protein